MSDIVGNRKAAKVTLIVMILALICVSIYIAYLFVSGIKTANADSDDLILDTGVVYSGVSSLGVDLSGVPRGQVPGALDDAVQKILDSVKMDFAVDNKTITLSARDVGADIDTSELLAKAYAVGREGDFGSREAGIANAAQNGAEIPYELTYDQTRLEQSVRSKSAALNLEAKDAEVKIDKTQDEENLMCDLALTIVPEVTGIDINYDTLLAALNTKMQNEDCFGGDPVVADATVTQPKITAAQLAQQYQKIGTFQTEYSTSAYGRRYNIWKMATIINGVTIQPGETWSINDTAGPRTYDRGWQGAPGIEDGQYKDQAGGGICQTNSTLYNAIIRADLEVVDRTHHSWPLSYIDPGLDATISTGAPDFKFKNNTDSPVIIHAKCDGQAKTIEISIYRSAMDYKLDFTSNVISTSYTDAVKTQYDPSMTPGTSRQIQASHPKIVVEVYKHVYDLDGNEIETVKLPTETYRAFPAIVAVGPNPDGSVPVGTVPMPS